MNVLELFAVALTATPVPTGQVEAPPEELVTPGTIGFLVTFAVAVALVFLVRDMNRRVQRIQVRGERAGGTGATGTPDEARSGTGTGTAASDRDDPPDADGDPVRR